MSFKVSHIADWPLVSIENIATLQRGYDLPVHARTEGKYTVFAANGPHGTHNEAKVSGPGVVTGRSGTIGKVHFVEQEFWPLNTSLYVKDFHGNDPKWVYYMLQNFHLERFSQGAGVPTLNRNLVHCEKVVLPPLKEQRRMVAILDKANSIYCKRQNSINLANKLLSSLFLTMFGDPISNSKAWNIHPLSALTTKIGSGATPRGGKEAYVENGVSLIRSLNIHDNKFTYKNIAFITELQASDLSNVNVEKNDLLLNITGASVCRCCIVPENVLPARVNQHVCIIRPVQDKINTDYLLHYFVSKGYKNRLLSIASAGGATREALTKKQIEELDIPVPPIALQREFALKREKVLSIASKFKEGDEFAFFSSLNQKAFSGKL